MNNKVLEKNGEMEINLGRVFRAVLDRIWLTVLVAVLCAVVVFTGTFLFITPQYQSAAMFYVNNSNLSLGDTSVSISSGDLTTSRNLVDSYIVILNTRETLVDVIDYAGVSCTYGELKGMLSAQAVNETEIFRVTVTNPDPHEAEKIANAIAYILPKRIGTIIDGTSAKVVDAAVVPSSPSSPSYSTNTFIGFMLGFLLAAGYIALREIFDITIRTEEDVTQITKLPILAAVPDMLAPSKGSSYYYSDSEKGKSKKKKKKKGAYAATKKTGKQPSVIGGNISFSASEAYKLLRTKLQFSFADGNACHVIGLSSALSGEGKSLTSVNLAYALAQLNKNVILIDCDMRRPTLAEKLGVEKAPGLSSYLTGQSDLQSLVQYCNSIGYSGAFDVITAGQNPPNPVELLSSQRMKDALAVLRKTHDYVILDLPPVGEVTDALVVSNDADGMLLVVRENYCDRIALAETVGQFESVHAKILGMVVNCTNEHSGKYGQGYYKRYYRRYYHRYYNKYASPYENNDRKVSDQGQEDNS